VYFTGFLIEHSKKIFCFARHTLFQLKLICSLSIQKRGYFQPSCVLQSWNKCSSFESWDNKIKSPDIGPRASQRSKSARSSVDFNPDKKKEQNSTLALHVTIPTIFNRGSQTQMHQRTTVNQKKSICGPQFTRKSLKIS
jgi:hypothetical protein